MHIKNNINIMIQSSYTNCAVQQVGIYLDSLTKSEITGEIVGKFYPNLLLGSLISVANTGRLQW